MSEAMQFGARRSAGPSRRPPEAGPRAERPGGRISRPPSRARLAAVRSFTAMNRVLRRTPLGAACARRVARHRESPTVDVELRRGGPGLDGLRLAWVSDLHAGCFFDGDDVRRVFDEVAAGAPDLVCLGGDLIEGAHTDEFRLYEEVLASLSPPLGVVAVAGNHEYFASSDVAYFREALESHGITFLVNEGVRLERGGATLWIAGVDDLSLGTPHLASALDGAAADEPVLLLSHHPDLFLESSWAGVDLTLAGHTHAGQIALGSWIAFKRSRYGYHRGRFEREGATLYVGRGAGVTGIPLRVNAAAEIPFFRLRAARAPRGPRSS